MGNLSPELAGSVRIELARAVERLPGRHGMPGGSRYELKWDGLRVGVVCGAAGVRLWSRNGKELTAKFPDVRAAVAAQVTADVEEARFRYRSWPARRFCPQGEAATVFACAEQPESAEPVDDESAGG